MIKSIDTYLITDGNGQEAVKFYAEALKAEVISLMTWEEGVPNCPEEHKHLVMNAQLMIGAIRLMLSDENPEFEFKVGHNVVPTIMVDSVEEAKYLYDKLSVEAQSIAMPLQKTFWSPAYANFTDKFGVLWQISTEL